MSEENEVNIYKNDVIFDDPEVPDNDVTRNQTIEEQEIKNFPPFIKLWSYNIEKVGSNKKLLNTLLILTYLSTLILLYNIVFSFSDKFLGIDIRKNFTTGVALSFVYLVIFTPLVYRFVFIQAYRNLLFVVNTVNRMKDENNTESIGYMIFNISFGLWLLLTVVLMIGVDDFGTCGILSLVKLLQNYTAKELGISYFVYFAICAVFITFTFIYFLVSLIVYIKFMKLIYGQTITADTSKVTNPEVISKPLVNEVKEPQNY